MIASDSRERGCFHSPSPAVSVPASLDIGCLEERAEQIVGAAKMLLAMPSKRAWVKISIAAFPSCWFEGGKRSDSVLLEKQTQGKRQTHFYPELVPRGWESTQVPMS